MQIQIVTFNLKDLSDADYRRACDGWAPAFAAVPGLISKVWLADEPTNTYGGVYTWVDREAMEAFARERLLQGVRVQPELRQHRRPGLRRPRWARAGSPGRRSRSRPD